MLIFKRYELVIVVIKSYAQVLKMDKSSFQFDIYANKESKSL